VQNPPATVTPQPTATLVATATPQPTATPQLTATPIFTGTGIVNRLVQFYTTASITNSNLNTSGGNTTLVFGETNRTYTYPNVTGNVPMLETANYFTLENYVKGDKAGVMNRLSDSWTSPTDHFRSGVIPTGFTWQGAPFTTPTIVYNYGGDYLQLVSNANNQRSFLSMPITNTAENWKNKNFLARVSGRYYGGMGIRVDDGTDNNYVEFFLDASAISGMSTLKWSKRAGGGAVTTTATSYAIPSEKYATLSVFSYYSAPNYYFYFYTIGEDGGSNSIAAYYYAFAPAAGRIGLVFNTYVAGTGVICMADWLLNSGWA
jgi:hypothetical protein